MSVSDVEIVKKGHLRYKLSGHYSENGVNSRHPREGWFVFKIGTSASGRILDLFNSEREGGKKNAHPRIRMFLRDIVSVSISDRDKPNMFILFENDGSTHQMEARSENECHGWVFALNAVLFGRGTDGRHLIQFSVNVNKCAQFSYHGAGLLEIRDDQMIVWSQGEREEVVRWKLGHIRSFKAKLSILEIIAGSRSSTGEGTFTFGTQESVLITHTLETIIDRLSREKKAKNMKAHQALPPLPPTVPPISFPTTPPSLPPQGHVRLCTNTKDLVPGFSDVPDLSVRVSTEYDYADSVVRRIPTLPLKQPEHSSYNRLGLTSSRFSKSTSDSSLSSTVKMDIYSSELEYSVSPGREQSRHSMKSKFDYAYVETDPQVKILSPTAAEDSIGLGEIRHNSSPRSNRKISSKTKSAIIISSDYQELDEEGYSSLNPVNVTDNLPKGMYSPLDFTSGVHVHVDDLLQETDGDLPPPLPPPPIERGKTLPLLRPLTGKGYQNVGPRPTRQISDEGERKELFDSNGSVEIALETSGKGTDTSPKLIKKSSSPRVTPRNSPRQSPTVPRRTANKYETITPREPTSNDEYSSLSCVEVPPKHMKIKETTADGRNTRSSVQQSPTVHRRILEEYDSVMTSEPPCSSNYSSLSRDDAVSSNSRNTRNSTKQSPPVPRRPGDYDDVYDDTVDVTSEQPPNNNYSSLLHDDTVPKHKGNSRNTRTSAKQFPPVPVPRRPAEYDDVYDDTGDVTSEHPPSNNYSSLSHVGEAVTDLKKELEIVGDSSHSYCQLTSFNQKPGTDGCDPSVHSHHHQGFDSPYAQLSHKKSKGTPPSDYNLHHHSETNTHGTESPYSKFNRTTIKQAPPITQRRLDTNNTYSTLSSCDLPNPPAVRGDSGNVTLTEPPNYEEVTCSMELPPHTEAVYNDVNSAHPYDEVSLEPTTNSHSHESYQSGCVGSSIYRDDCTLSRKPEPLDGGSKRESSHPPVPPRREANTREKPRRPPVKPKPYTPKKTV